MTIGERVKIWWRGQYESGRIIEVLGAHRYRVKIWNGEIAFRHEDDIIRF